MSRREKVWVVRPSDGATVGDIVRRAGEDASAVEEGRVFVGKRRVSRIAQPVRAGDVVRIGARPPAAREAAGRAASNTGDRASIDVPILLERGGLVACDKPAGIPTVPDHAGASHSLVALVAARIGVRATDLRVTSRLDREVSGVVVFALDAAAEDRLRVARAEGRYARRYVALAGVSGDVLPEQGVWAAPIGRGKDPRLRAAHGLDAKPASTRWRRIARATTSASPTTVVMLAVDPVTGRTHQIRVHASHEKAPLIGDRDYGGLARIVFDDGRVLQPARIALHAARVVVPGEGGELVEATAAPPAELVGVWAALGGDAAAWDEAVTCETAAPQA